MIITPTFTAAFDTNFGANAAAARAAWSAAAQVFTSHFSDNININITVNAVAGTGVFGQSSMPIVSISYADLLARVTADATTQDDQIAIGPGGSMTACDPTNGAGTWSLTRAQAKALGQIPDDMSGDGSTTFGAGFPFTFSGPITAGTYDFQGIAAHEISEVMGRLGTCGLKTGPAAFTLVDNFSYTGPGTKGLRGGPGNLFSIDNGITLLKLFNDPTVNGFDCSDWAPGTNDAFNQFSAAGVVNPVSAVDLRLMDVIGYDLRFPTMSVNVRLVSRSGTRRTIEVTVTDSTTRMALQGAQVTVFDVDGNPQAGAIGIPTNNNGIARLSYTRCLDPGDPGPPRIPPRPVDCDGTVTNPGYQDAAFIAPK